MLSSPRIVNLRVALAGDRRRVRLQAEVDPIAEPYPYLEFTILAPDGDVLAQTLVMGVLEPLTAMTLHLRAPAPADEARPYTARGRLFYGAEDQEEETLSLRTVEFVFP